LAYRICSIYCSKFSVIFSIFNRHNIECIGQPMRALSILIVILLYRYRSCMVLVHLPIFIN
jgi:hypothetical protein